MTAKERIEILESFRNPWPGSSHARELVSDADMLLTVWLRPKGGGELDVARAVALGSTLPAAREYVGPGHDRTPDRILRAIRYSHREAFGATVSIYADAERRQTRSRHSMSL